MLEFLFFMLIILGFMAGAGFLYVLLNRLTHRVGPGGSDANLSLLREELDSLTSRVGRMEEELDFYKQLKAPERTSPETARPGSEDPTE